MGREGGKGKGPNDDTQNNVVVSFPAERTRRPGTDLDTDQSAEVVHFKTTPIFRVVKEFSEWIHWYPVPEADATANQWAEYFCGVVLDCNRVSKVDNETPFESIANRIRYEDTERILTLNGTYRRGYPKFFEAVEKHRDECETAENRFKMWCTSAGVSDGSQDPDDFSPMLTKDDGPFLALRLLALGDKFLKHHPGLLKALKKCVPPLLKEGME